MIVRKYGEEEGDWCFRALREGYGRVVRRLLGASRRSLTKGLILG